MLRGYGKILGSTKLLSIYLDITRDNPGMKMKKKNGIPIIKNKSFCD